MFLLVNLTTPTNTYWTLTRKAQMDREGNWKLKLLTQAWSLPSTSIESRSLNYSGIPCEFSKCYTYKQMLQRCLRKKGAKTWHHHHLKHPKWKKKGRKETKEEEKRGPDILGPPHCCRKSKHQLYHMTDPWWREHRTPVRLGLNLSSVSP